MSRALWCSSHGCSTTAANLSAQAPTSGSIRRAYTHGAHLAPFGCRCPAPRRRQGAPASSGCPRHRGGGAGRGAWPSAGPAPSTCRTPSGVARTDEANAERSRRNAWCMTYMPVRSWGPGDVRLAGEVELGVVGVRGGSGRHRVLGLGRARSARGRACGRLGRAGLDPPCPSLGRRLGEVASPGQAPPATVDDDSTTPPTPRNSPCPSSTRPPSPAPPPPRTLWMPCAAPLDPRPRGHRPHGPRGARGAAPPRRRAARPRP